MAGMLGNCLVYVEGADLLYLQHRLASYTYCNVVWQHANMDTARIGLADHLHTTQTWRMHRTNKLQAHVLHCEAEPLVRSRYD